ncbi:MAG: DNA topoisomerase I [Candidatus Woesearchaeota archaeon]
MVELIITEKPSAAKKIAEGLADTKPSKLTQKGVSYYSLKHDNNEILVVSAVGHLFTVAEKEKSFKYPSYDIEWVPNHKAVKTDYSKKYYDVIKKITKKADSFTVACDYDVEGEVIGLNVLRYICKQKDASRMKFSTLVKEDVKKSYKSKLKSIDWGQAKAGETRHFLDWLYGINISRALMLAMKHAGRFKVLSSGRVQGPALKILVDKEKEIKAFVPKTYFQIQIIVSDTKFKAMHELDKIFDKEKAENIYKKLKSNNCVVESVTKRQYKQSPPNPFDLGSLQSEAYKVFKISPKRTLQIAQDLYLKGLTSYPRTSSQQLPEELGFKKILSGLAKNSIYAKLISKLPSKLKPNNGKKTDPAHPAIYPTGNIGKLEGQNLKVYDLIVKRFFATFSTDAVKESMKVVLDLDCEKFNAKGSAVLVRGWHELYEPYVMQKDEALPALKEKDSLKVHEKEFLEKQTEPPRRYTPASLISELEKRGLGTKATRADIIQSLYERGYVDEKSIQATELGILLVDTLEKYCPEILDEKLTREFEKDMELIRDDNSKAQKILDDAKKHLDIILNNMKKHEKSIGSHLVDANKETLDIQNSLGPCPKCGEGTIMIRKGKYGKFAACNKYPDCKTTFNLPNGAVVKKTDKVSDSGYPIVLVANKGKRPQEISLNHKDNIPEDKKDLVKKLEKEGYTHSDGTKMKIVYGFYGPFLAAQDYPKVKKIISLDEVKF